MQFFNPISIVLLTLSVSCACSTIKRQAGGTSFAGANNRYIHGVTTDHEKEVWAQSLQQAGAKVVRLFLDPAYNCQQGSSTVGLPGLEPDTVGTYDDTILDAMDSLLGIIHSYGLKAIISPHNANDLEPTQDRDVCDAYCSKYKSASSFYTSPLAAEAYDNRLLHILNYESKAFPSTPWKSLGQVIEGFDIQNEPFIPYSTRNPDSGPSPGQSLVTSPQAGSWICDRAKTIQHTVYGSGIKVLSGGIGGDDLPGLSFGFLPAAITCSYLDVIALHEFKHAGDYGNIVWYNESLQSLLESNRKTVLMEEFGVGGSQFPSSDFDGITSTLNTLGLPWLYWEYVSGADSPSSCPAGADKCCSDASSYDGYEIGPGTSKPLSIGGGLTFGDRVTAASGAALNSTGMVL